MSIEKFQGDYQKAKAIGDAIAMQTANNGANAIRTSTGQELQYASTDINNIRIQNSIQEQVPQEGEIQGDIPQNVPDVQEPNIDPSTTVLPIEGGETTIPGTDFEYKPVGAPVGGEQVVPPNPMPNEDTSLTEPTVPPQVEETPKTPLELQSTVAQLSPKQIANQKLTSDITNFLTKVGGKLNGATKITNSILFNSNNPDGGQIVETNNGRFIQGLGGHLSKLSDGDYSDFMLSKYGFAKVEKVPYTKPVPVKAPVVNTPNSPGKTNTSYQLGSVSGKYESNGRADAVSSGKGDLGGVSYGMYQFSSKTGGAASFMNFLKTASPATYKQLASGGAPGSAGFTAQWKAVAKKDPAGFGALQQKAIETKYYLPAVASVKKATGIDVSTKSQALQEAIWSTSIQHGTGAVAKIIQRALVRTGGNQSDKVLIEAIYNERGANGGAKYFSSSSAAVRKGVSNRFVNEKNDLLKMLAKGGGK